MKSNLILALGILVAILVAVGCAPKSENKGENPAGVPAPTAESPTISCYDDISELCYEQRVSKNEVETKKQQCVEADLRFELSACPANAIAVCVNATTGQKIHYYNKEIFDLIGAACTSNKGTLVRK